MTNATATGATLRRQIQATLLPGFLGTTLPGWLARRLREGLGGVCVFGPNIESREQLRELTAAILRENPLAVIAIDEEGGDVTRLYYDVGAPFPGNAVLGRLGDTGYTEAVARTVGWELRRAGCTVTFAPDVDVNSNSDNPVIGIRSFGSDPALVAAHSEAWVRGVQSTGVAASPKHFPGHGDTAEDSHLALPVVDLSLERLRSRELPPFAAAIGAGAKTIMTSHIMLPQLDPRHPATLSRRILQGLLREELGFTGVIVSDALDMAGASGSLGIPGAAAAALGAGCDLLCIGTDNTDEQLAEIEEAVMAAIEAGTLPAARVAEAAERVLTLAAEGVAERKRIPVPVDASPAGDHLTDTDRVVEAFDLGEAARRWIADPPDGCSIIRIDTVANIAVGQVPWGPFAELHADPGSALAAVWRGSPIVSCTGAGDRDVVLAASRPVLVIGKDNHRHAVARDIIDNLRADGRQVLVVDMGWPSDDRAYADLATFGASRLVGRALLELLAPRRSERTN